MTDALLAALFYVAGLISAALDALFAFAAHLVTALGALARLARRAWDARKGEGALAGRLAPQLLSPDGQREVFAVLRAFQPVLRIDRGLARSYPAPATVILTRRADVLDALRRDADFEVVYGPRMREITGGADFFLGMQPGWPYERDTSAMRLAMRRADADARVGPRALAQAQAVVDAAAGGLDAPRDLFGPVAWDMVADYFGAAGPDRAATIAATTAMFWFLFNDLGADDAVGARARAAAAQMRDWLDAEIAGRKAAGRDADDLIGRCLRLQAAGAPGMDDLGIRNNLIGLMIGAIPTLSKAATLALDELLDRPDALRAAGHAARSGDAATVAAHVWEALRFRPHNPVVYRRATRHVRLPRATLRGRVIPAGALVFAATHSAMFDPLDVDAPRQFRTDRAWETYVHWGEGTHRCFGDALNRVMIPAMLTPLLARPGLRRSGPRDDAGTPFPVSLPILWE